MNTFLLLGSLLVLLIGGVPIGFSMAIAGSIGLLAIGGIPTLLGILSTAPLSSVAVYELASIPMFLLMAEFVIITGIGNELFDTLRIWVGRVRGGLAIATVLAGSAFGAISGSSTAGAATLASTSLPAMLRHGYDRDMATGVVAISGTLAMLIPPSIALIIYALLADVSVSKLLMAGIVPAIVVMIVIILTVQLLIFLKPSRAPVGQSYSWREKISALKGTFPVFLLMGMVSGSIYTGIATPSEASALGAFGAFLIALARGVLTLGKCWEALAGAARLTAMIITIVLGAHIFGYALTMTQTTQSFVRWIGSLGLTPYVTITLILGLKLVLGFFLDQLAILLLTVPIMVPLVVSIGFDPIWFGVMMVITAEVGMVTPPVGMNIYVIARYTGRPPSEMFAGVWPHVFAHLIAIAIMVAFPQIVLWLPSTMN